jgi:hypothetical protein
MLASVALRTSIGQVAERFNPLVGRSLLAPHVKQVHPTGVIDADQT